MSLHPMADLEHDIIRERSGIARDECRFMNDFVLKLENHAARLICGDGEGAVSLTLNFLRFGAL
jgi:hypothetical protein